MKKLIDKIKKLFVKYREIIVYVIFGGLTTLVNFVVYYFLTRALKCPITPANIMGNVLSILFAYVTNRAFVFQSKTQGKEMVKEMLSFFLARAFSFFLDVAIVWFFASLLRINDLVVKVASNIIVIVLNYLLSKLVIFKKKNNRTMEKDEVIVEEKEDN